MFFDISQPIADVVDLFGHTTQVRKLTVEQIRTPVYLGKLGMQGTDVSSGFRSGTCAAQDETRRSPPWSPYAL